jgi:ketosteroid isomerase-like protein
MSDPILPPYARRPQEALELVAQALSDGDLEAALAQYEDNAQLLVWAGPGNGAVHRALAEVMDLRLPVAIRVSQLMRAPGLALISCERVVSGTRIDGSQVRLAGEGWTAVRHQPDGSWRVAADTWRLAEVPLVPPAAPPAAVPMLTDYDAHH